MSAANSSPNSAELGAGRRVEVNTSDITAPMVSAATSLLYCAHKENGDYQYVGLDWMTGALRERWTFPDDSRLWGHHHDRRRRRPADLGGAFGVKRVIGN